VLTQNPVKVDLSISFDPTGISEAYDGMYTMSDSQDCRLAELFTDRFGNCLSALTTTISPDLATYSKHQSRLARSAGFSEE
jgi:hypothetical protein